MKTSLPSGGVKVVRLSIPVRVAVPPLLLSSLQKGAIGFSFEPGRLGGIVGVALAALSFFMGFALYPAFGVVAPVLATWSLGTTGLVMIINSRRGLAFVRPYCAGCRLYPLIVEHEAMHLAGEGSDRRIWLEVSREHSTESLGLADDPTICSFCPIAKRLSEH